MSESFRRRMREAAEQSATDAAKQDPDWWMPFMAPEPADRAPRRGARTSLFLGSGLPVTSRPVREFEYWPGLTLNQPYPFEPSLDTELPWRRVDQVNLPPECRTAAFVDPYNDPGPWFERAQCLYEGRPELTQIHSKMRRITENPLAGPCSRCPWALSRFDVFPDGEVLEEENKEDKRLKRLQSLEYMLGIVEANSDLDFDVDFEQQRHETELRLWLRFGHLQDTFMGPVAFALRETFDDEENVEEQDDHDSHDGWRLGQIAQFGLGDLEEPDRPYREYEYRPGVPDRFAELNTGNLYALRRTDQTNLPWACRTALNTLADPSGHQAHFELEMCRHLEMMPADTKLSAFAALRSGKPETPLVGPCPACPFVDSCDDFTAEEEIG